MRPPTRATAQTTTGTTTEATTGTTTQTSGTRPVVHLVPGPERHGVTRHALDLLGRPAAAGHLVRRVLPEGPGAQPRAADTQDALLAALPRRDAPVHVHLHLTDHLLAPTAGACAEVVEGLADEVPLSLTLHDLPQPADGPGRYERRRAAYARMATRARGVVVASEHERTLLLTALAAERLPAPPIAVVPLPLHPPEPGGPLAPAGPRAVAVFGYLYPGKGHRDALEALPALGAGYADVGLVALGEVSPGHEHEAEALRERAATLGRTLTITGHLPEAQVREALRRAWVPLAPHRHVSASGSIGSWLSAGRRPLVPTGTYVDELDARCPGALLRYGPGTEHADVAQAVRAAFDTPSLTWLDPAVRLTPDGAQAATALVRTVETWAAAARRRAGADS